MWTPISVDKFVKLHLKKNPKENEKVLRVRIEAALEDFKNGIKCQCGKDIWIVGSASAPFGCFSCITGKDHPRGDYEIDSALEKRDRLGRRHIDEMDPRKIAGMFDDDGYEIRRDTIKMQPNIGRFPKDFMFILTFEEFKILRSQNASSSWGDLGFFNEIILHHQCLSTVITIIFS